MASQGSISSVSVESEVSGDTSHQSQQPSVYRDKSFHGILITQFLGAFNDNVYKQLVIFACLRLAVGNRGENLQGIATILFAAPFIFMSGGCGYLSDLFSKRSIVVVSKVLEIVIMVLGLIAFWFNDINMMLVVLCLMGMQSALFGPSKYGILPELFADKDLPRVNGWITMTTFLAIILGFASAGYIMDVTWPNLWYAGVFCIVVSLLGTISSLLIAPTPVAKPGLKFDWSSLFVNSETMRLLRTNKKLLTVILASSAFWMTGGLVYPSATNDLGKFQFELSDTKTAQLAVCTGVGITLGCVLAGFLSRGRFNAMLVRLGVFGMFGMLMLLGAPGGYQGTLLGVGGSAAALIALGVFAGFFSVPVQVYLQSKAPREQKGRIIGVMNLANFIGIALSGFVYHIANKLFTSISENSNLEIPFSAMFWVAAVLILPVMLFYHPRSELLEEAPIKG